MDAYPGLNDQWLESAFVGVAARIPRQFIAAALDSSNPAAFTNLVAQLAGQVGDKQDDRRAAQLDHLRLHPSQHRQTGSKKSRWKL